jgi:hypothetical protein
MMGLKRAFFGLTRAGQYGDGAVRVEGWYRRAPVPYIETKTLYVDGRRVFRSQIPLAKYVVSGALVIAGLAWMAAVFVGAQSYPVDRPVAIRNGKKSSGGTSWPRPVSMACTWPRWWVS